MAWVADLGFVAKRVYQGLVFERSRGLVAGALGPFNWSNGGTPLGEK